MNKLIIEIETDNSAFEDSTEAEVNRILDNIKAKINYDYLTACGVSLSINDTNGNKVGSIKGVNSNV